MSRTTHHTPYGRQAGVHHWNARLGPPAPAGDAHPHAPAGADSAQRWHATSTLRYRSPDPSAGRPVPQQVTRTTASYSYSRAFHAASASQYANQFERAARTALVATSRAARAAANAALRAGTDLADLDGLEQLDLPGPRHRGSAWWASC